MNSIYDPIHIEGGTSQVILSKQDSTSVFYASGSYIVLWDFITNHKHYLVKHSTNISDFILSKSQSFIISIDSSI